MSKTLTVKTIFNALEELAPKEKAYSWDNVGLQIGSANQKATKIMITLDVLESVVDEAIANNVDVIIAHHPLLFKPLKQINFDTPEGRVIAKLIRHNITVYASHTNLDIVAGGVNDMLAEQLGIQKAKPLVQIGTEKLFKYAVHVPVSHLDKIKQVIGDAGAGKQGDYTHCSFEIAGIGSFKPGTQAEPFIGEIGKIAKVEEVKIEALVNESSLKKVVAAVLEVHPYEEPAYDIIELKNSGANYGLGRIGEVKTQMNLKQYAEGLKEKLELSHVRIVGDLKKMIKKVAVIGGSGEKYIHAAKHAGADVYITGDLGFHQAQIAMEMGLAVIDAGHYIESIMKESVKDYLEQKLTEFDVEIITSECNTDPFQYL